MALLSVLSRVGTAFGWVVRAHGVDHGLRAEAATELDLAQRYAEEHGVPFSRTVLKVPAGGNLQARARELRWKALVAEGGEGGAIATGHHADDRAETILMRLLRGAGARGLGVMPARDTAPFGDSVTLVRPLLRAQRTDVLTHLEQQGVPSAADPSNVDPRYLRTRVRQLLPLLKELDANVVTHLNAVADELACEPSPLYTLPRATQEAVARLISTRSADARVWLPGGLVLRVDRRKSSD
jgi:tRNA(Ile)-lysidine synthase